MIVSLLIIGDELLNGRIKDLNTQVAAQFCDRLGLSLNHTITIRDDKEAFNQAVDFLGAHSQGILISGGLGPTEDDITKTMLASYIRQPLIENDLARDLVANHYRAFDKEWTPNLNHYHMIPRGVTPLHNPEGLAPGLFFKNESLWLAALPGVPREFKAMLEQSIGPQISDQNLIKTQQLSIRTFGIPEEKIFGHLMPNLWGYLAQFGKVSSLPQIRGIDILVRSPQLGPSQINEIKNFLNNSPLAEFIWSFDDTSLVQAIIELAKEKSCLISLAESCTGGLTASRMTDISGCSSIFMGSAVTYSNESKQEILGVKESTLLQWGAVSEEVAREMAQGSLKKYQSNIALSFTGIAGPGGGSIKKPVGMVCMAVATEKKVKSHTYYFRGTREQLKWRFSEQGLFLLLNELKNY